MDLKMIRIYQKENEENKNSNKIIDDMVEKNVHIGRIMISAAPSMEILTGSLQVAANGMNLVSNNNQTNSNDPADFFITGSSTYSKTHLAVKGNSSNLSPGYNLKTTDKLNIVYQKTMSP